MVDRAEPLELPGGARFAFTILDDTDVATVENVRPIYRLLDSLGMRATKTVWPLRWDGVQSIFDGSQTLEDPEYLEFARDLQTRGFEIASHGAAMESSPRARTELAIARFHEAFGHDARVYVNHSHNQENIYWGADRFDSPILRRLYALASGKSRAESNGHVVSTPYWWGDLCQARHEYVRNLTFREPNIMRVNPSMPYRDPRRPFGRWWFSTSDADDRDAFVRLLNASARQRLATDGGVCIVSTHFGKRFTSGGSVHPDVIAVLSDLSRLDGWFPTVSQLLDWLRTRRASELLPPAEWRRMQWLWALEQARIRLTRG